VLKRAGAVVALLGAGSGSAAAGRMPMPMPTKKAKAKKAAPVGALNATQLRALEAMAARIVPSDGGPGAAEAGAANYINLSLNGYPHVRDSLAATFVGTSVQTQLPAYVAGLAATDAYAQSKKGQPFASLSAADQDAVLTDMSAGTATGTFLAGSASFFNLVRTHTLQGMLCDPYYGGNKNFVGWAWVGYPGIRMPVKPEHQRLGSKPPLMRMSAYAMPSYKSGPPTVKG
jgi:gluconate 2-dehydrogenase gamma chain